MYAKELVKSEKPNDRKAKGEIIDRILTQHVILTVHRR